MTELQTRTKYGYDSNGNAVSKNDSTGITTYGWDFENRLGSVALPGSGGTVSFAYDPFGRRIRKMSPTGTSIFAYDGDNLVEETNGSGTAVARYSQGLNIDEPLAMLRGGTSTFYNADGLGSITSLANAAGSLTQTYTFDSFGRQTAASGSLTNPFQYTGRESDPETGLYYYRARYYDPDIARFLSEDQRDLGSLGEWLNLYFYVKNSPANLIDPFGLFTVKPDVPYPSLQIQALVDCIEFKTLLHLQITSTTDSHDPNTPHTNGVAVDLHYDNPMATKSVLCAAAGCGAGFGLDEKEHPSHPWVKPHIHLQIPAGKKGGHGDLPLSNCHDCER